MSDIYQFISAQGRDYPVQQLCQVLGANRSSYYEYRNGKTYATTPVELAEVKQVCELFSLHRRRYGSRRMAKALQQKGVEIGRFKVRRLMRDQSLKAIQPKSFVPKTTNSKHKLGYAPNVLTEVGFPSEPNVVYVGDITYLPTTYGSWLYLNVWIDLFSRSVVGWKVDTHMEESLVVDSLKQAVHKRSPKKGLIIHSDRGGQYAGAAFKEVLTKHHCIQSMSGADNPYDNAFAESFFSRFKAELLEKGTFENIADATTEIFNYIEMYYNTHRLHSGLGYLSPAHYEAYYYRDVLPGNEAERNAFIEC
jgi:transposase InsO family protein